MNYFEAEQLIKQHLIDNITTIPADCILVASDVESMKNEDCIAPSVTILYSDDAVETDDSGRTSACHSVKQIWHIIVTVLDNGDNAERYSLGEAGIIVHEVLRLLHGFKPSVDHSRLVREESPFSVSYDNENAYFPFSFSTTLVL